MSLLIQFLQIIVKEHFASLIYAKYKILHIQVIYDIKSTQLLLKNSN